MSSSPWTRPATTPDNPDVIVRTDRESVEEGVAKTLTVLEERGYIARVPVRCELPPLEFSRPEVARVLVEAMRSAE